MSAAIALVRYVVPHPKAVKTLKSFITSDDADLKASAEQVLRKIGELE